ncbi:MAG: hypothetical protein IPM54_41965 [Polyangiaceae bacterium]|nr:hypothetical protein [Polyangiaceae bacterium]
MTSYGDAEVGRKHSQGGEKGRRSEDAKSRGEEDEAVTIALRQKAGAKKASPARTGKRS